MSLYKNHLQSYIRESLLLSFVCLYIPSALATSQANYDGSDSGYKFLKLIYSYSCDLLAKYVKKKQLKDIY
jgi:hypothetical protein